jgi:hypothetical protein
MQESTRIGDDSIWNNNCNIVPDDGNSSNRKSDKSSDKNQEAAVDLSVLEAEVSLQEATLETLSVQLRTLEELLQTEKLTYEQNVGQLSTLRSREAKLQQSVLDNTELVKSVENTLLKTLEALKRKMTSLTTTTTPPTTTATTNLQSDAKTENVPPNYDGFEDDDLDDSADGILSDMMELDDDDQYSVEEKNITEEAHEITKCEADFSSKAVEEEEKSTPDDMQTVLAPATDSITATDNIHSIAMERAKRNPVRTMNSYMENRCWSGSLFSNYIFQNPKLLFKVLSIQSNEIQCLAASPSPHSTAPTYAEHHSISSRTLQNPQKQLQQLSTLPIATTNRSKTFYHQFTHSTCLDPITLLFHWHSPGYRYTLPWEHDENTALVSLSNYRDASSNEDDTTCTNTNKLISSLQPVKAESETSQLDPTRILCPYDLTGKCLDHSCPFQHLTSNSSPCEPTKSQGVLHGDLGSLNIPDELRFVPLPDIKPYNILLCESLPSIDEKVAAAVDGKEKRFRKKRRYEMVGKAVSITNADEIESDDFVSLPRTSFTGNISDDCSSIGEPDSTDMIQFIKTADDTNKIARKEISNSTHAFDSSSDALPWWWPSTISLKEFSSAESRTTQSNPPRNSFPLPLLDDAIPIISNELYSLKLKPTDGGEIRHENWIKVLAGVVDLLRLSFSAGRVAEVTPFLSSFLAVKISRSIEFSHAFNLCLTHVRSIVDHFLLQPNYSSTVCDIFHIQLKLFFVSEWLFAYHTNRQNEKNFAMDLLWSNSLESLLTEAIDVASDNRLPYSTLHLQVQSMIGDLFSSSDFKEDEIKWLSMLSRCKELGDKIARLTLRVESPYIIPDFLEYLWLCIDERKEYLQSLSREQSFACIMTCIVPSLFSGVAVLSIEDVQRNKISSVDKQEYRLFAAFRSVDSCVQGIIYRILALHERKTTSCLGRHMFEGLLLAPVVALSASIAVELGLHSKAVSFLSGIIVVVSYLLLVFLLTHFFLLLPIVLKKSNVELNMHFSKMHILLGLRQLRD